MGYLINSLGIVETVDSFFENHPEQKNADREIVRRYIATNFAWPVVLPRPDRVRVLVRMSKVSGAALIGLLYFLADNVRGRVAVSNFVETWEHAVFGRSSLAIDYLANLSEANPRQRRIAFEDEELLSTTANSKPAFAPLLELYRDNRRSVFELATLGRMDELGQRYNIMRYNCHVGTLSFERISGNFSIVTSDWAANAKGLQFEDQPNSNYAVCAKRGYEEACRRGTPIFSRVRTIVQCQKTNKPVDIEYNRLLLPLRTTVDEALVLCTSADTARNIVSGSS